MVTNGQTAAAEHAEIVAKPVPVALIDPSSLNRHCDDSDADLAELAQTILENGLLSPISIRPRDDGRYEIICGERRWRAFRLLERDTIPCFVKDLDDTQAQIERIVENYQRRDPSFMEQGEAVAALMKLTDRDVSEVANRLGQSVSWVRRRAKLPNLIPAWREELEKPNTPYFAIRASVEKMEELAVLPPATQQVIFDSNVLRYVKTTAEMRKTIAKYFMSLDAKPWSREWEKKTFSGSGKKRCDACMRRSDRENALFADPDDANAGKKMCLDPQCWKAKCLSWAKSQIHANPEIVPIRHGYSYGTDDLTEYFGVKPVSYYDWEERDDAEAREGYTEAVGVFVDGPEIGTTVNIWLELPDENGDDGEDENGGVSEIHHWRKENVRKYREHEALAALMAAEIAEYLAGIDVNATIPAPKLEQNKIRACFWFGVIGYMETGQYATRLDDPDWNPLASAWSQTTRHIAEMVSSIAAEGETGIYNAEHCDTDRENAKILAAMFEIPLDVIGTRASETLYKATASTNAKDAAAPDELDAADMDSNPVDAAAEPETPVVPVVMEAMTDPDDCMQLDGALYLSALATIQ